MPDTATTHCPPTRRPRPRDPPPPHPRHRPGAPPATLRLAPTKSAPQSPQIRPHPSASLASVLSDISLTNPAPMDVSRDRSSTVLRRREVEAAGRSQSGGSGGGKKEMADGCAPRHTRGGPISGHPPPARTRPCAHPPATHAIILRGTNAEHNVWRHMTQMDCNSQEERWSD